jgi:hypothetical protein
VDSVGSKFNIDVFVVIISILLTYLIPLAHLFLVVLSVARRLLKVTYDEHSFMVYGERIMVFSGDYHPFRLPVPGLWLNVFRKVKALGFIAVSFILTGHYLEENLAFLMHRVYLH